MKFVILDCGGLHVGTADAIAKQGNQVSYWNPWQSAYPAFQDYAPGVGLKNVKKVMDWASEIDDADCIVIPDVGMGETATWLRKKGYNVFGAGVAEFCEQDRWKSTEVMKQYGVHYPETIKCTGLDDALNKLRQGMKGKRETNQLASGEFFVKFDTFRGSLESFPAESLEQAEYMLDSARANLGPYASSLPLVIQRKVEGVETGCDVFFDGTKFVMPGMWGFESGGNYIGYITDDMSIFQKDLERLTPFFQKMGYRGAFSMEGIYDGKECYWIDWTCRMPMPLGLMYCLFSSDIAQMFHDCAKGQMNESTLPLGKYLGCMEVHSDEAANKYLPLEGNEHTCFMRYMGEGDKLYHVPGPTFVGIIGAQGSSIQEVDKQVALNTEGVSVYFGGYDTNFLEGTYDKFIKPLDELGVKFGPDSEFKAESVSPASAVLRKLLSS